jgi:putative membrane protein
MIMALAFLLAAAAPLSSSDRAFVTQALNGNTMEVHQGQIFGDSSDLLVEGFAKRMVTDHSQANTQLIAIADAHGMRAQTVAQEPNLPYAAATHASTLSVPQKEANVNGLSPVAYFEQQISIHEQAIALYKHEVASGTNDQVVSYARKTLPVIESHLVLARNDLAKERAEHHG